MINKAAKERLETQRNKYSDVEWKSTKGVYTNITNLDDEYLVNILRKVKTAEIVGRDLPLVEELQEYESIRYSAWAEYLYCEYVYRKATGLKVSKQKQEQVNCLDKEATILRDMFDDMAKEFAADTNKVVEQTVIKPVSKKEEETNDLMNKALGIKPKKDEWDEAITECNGVYKIRD